MSQNRLFKAVALIVVLVSAVVGYGVIGVLAAPQRQDAAMTLEFDIAEIPQRFVFDETPLHDDGMPAYGGEFITQGYLYPIGTLDDSDGVLENGDPEFPDLVLGEWTCRGWHIGDGGHTTEGYWVITTQTYSLADTGAIIVTDGYESAEIGASVTRAIVGGTGAYSTARGEQVQHLLGFTPYNSVKTRTTITVME